MLFTYQCMITGSPKEPMYGWKNQYRNLRGYIKRSSTTIHHHRTDMDNVSPSSILCLLCFFCFHASIQSFHSAMILETTEGIFSKVRLLRSFHRENITRVASAFISLLFFAGYPSRTCSHYSTRVELACVQGIAIPRA